LNRDNFIKLQDSIFDEVRRLNRVKGHDYAGDNDALANFKRNAKGLGVTPELIWGVYAGKHWDAIQTFVREGDVHSEPIESRIHDLINYLTLLLGLIYEKKGMVK